VVGKPEPYLVELALKHFRMSPDQALVIGDRIDTDIEAGRRAGCPVHLVLTGVTREAPDGLSSSPDLRALLD
jgi:4-nitrophenyl phosphatase